MCRKRRADLKLKLLPRKPIAHFAKCLKCNKLIAHPQFTPAVSLFDALNKRRIWREFADGRRYNSLQPFDRSLSSKFGGPRILSHQLLDPLLNARFPAHLSCFHIAISRGARRESLKGFNAAQASHNVPTKKFLPLV